MSMIVPFPQVLEEQPHLWQVVVVNGSLTAVLDQWTTLSISEDHDGVRVDLEVNGLEPMIGYMRMFVTDLLLYWNQELAYRVRIADSTDTLTRDAHTVQFSCVGYEKLLEKRILHPDVGAAGNYVLDTFDIDAAWSLINYTQLKSTLLITRGTAAAGVRRQRTLNWGDTILECVNDFAEADAGFDWWIDANRVWWAQKPRRGTSYADTIEWRWGAEIAEVVRQADMDDYASLVLTTGAQNETSIPNPPSPPTVYPPPNPQLVQLATKPLGLWEVSVSYSDVITDASLLEKANWHLADLANVRPTYKIKLEVGVWTPAIKIGDVFMMRVEGPPRLDIRVPVRLEELQIELTADGEESVSISARAEEPETMMSPLPLPGDSPGIVPLPSGRTVAQHRLKPWDDLASVMRGVDARIGRQERSPSA